ncbi:MAG: zinc ribbon domain-containing protein [Myxococcaceae bacterium]
MKCPACSVETEGPQLCTGCGALLAAGSCRSCKAALAAGDRACPKCTTTVRPGRSYMGFLVMGGIGLAVVVGLMLSNQPAAPAAAPAPPSSAPAAQPGPFAIAAPAQPAPVVPVGPAVPASPRAQADELFNQAMMASEGGNPEAVRQVVPPALAAYRALPALDDDGTFHVALLQLTGGDFPGARATADAMLAKQPNHLLALSVAARAAAGTGDAASSRKYNERLVASYDTEVLKTLPEYLDHGRVLPLQHEDAKKALGK